MAKVRYTHIDDTSPDIEQNYTMGMFGLMQSKKTHADYLDGETGFQVVFEGKKLAYTEEAGLVKGTVNEIRFLDGDGNEFASISDLNITKVKKLENILTGSGDFDGVSGLLFKVLEHNDTIIGTGHSDALAGEAGNDVMKAKGGDDFLTGNLGGDTMSGGGGNDTFYFFGEAGKDVITDFNLGDDENHDTIYIRETGFQIVKGAHNFVKFDFGDGSSVLLEGVKYADRGEIHADAIL